MRKRLRGRIRFAWRKFWGAEDVRDKTAAASKNWLDVYAFQVLTGRDLREFNTALMQGTVEIKETSWQS